MLLLIINVEFLSHLFVLFQILIVTVPRHLDPMQGHKEPEYTVR